MTGIIGQSVTIIMELIHRQKRFLRAWVREKEVYSRLHLRDTSQRYISELHLRATSQRTWKSYISELHLRVPDRATSQSNISSTKSSIQFADTATLQPDIQFSRNQYFTTIRSCKHFHHCNSWAYCWISAFYNRPLSICVPSPSVFPLHLCSKNRDWDVTRSWFVVSEMRYEIWNEILPARHNFFAAQPGPTSGFAPFLISQCD